MGKRTDLHKILVDILGSENVYYQPPASLQMKYDCIIYESNAAKTEFADNRPYFYKRRYKITRVYRNPDDIEVTDAIAQLPTCTFNDHYVADNLYHDVFTLYF